MEREALEIGEKNEGEGEGGKLVRDRNKQDNTELVDASSSTTGNALDKLHNAVPLIICTSPLLLP